MAIVFHRIAFVYLGLDTFIPPNFPQNSNLTSIAPIFPLLLTTAIGTTFEMVIDSENQQVQKEKIKKEKISAELSFLKSQINPHFLFNTLNNIYSLAASKSGDTTKAILLLSDLMRFMLYESNVDRIPIKSEIKFINDYISLQRLRISEKKDIEIDFHIEGEYESHFIEPMLFIPFVENAFKYGISYKDESRIMIKLIIKDSSIKFESFNKVVANFGKNGTDEHDSSGIGLKNLKRRLDLLYPGHYEMDVDSSNGHFKAYLNLNLNV
ncbi:MAG: sensor histidine kinase [Bacteroidota bacterium]